ncbi:alcohol oxidase [Eremomyces bilateralis CBS 781.70]|uniref:Alcohol oxidase n=1 Tax=Eremomyces bilateralis CBS 781.70 TaxID=1392243 RepID=A0A6G1GBW1_9PEZI|nr:alcohol oxidase [Eremomyces bilateralis CBS 781.70]KAF1815472.1 alcohol oxidase [Eremomyces bilateralis CBS 781.70]
MAAQYDFIVVGSGPGGSVVASRLAKSKQRPTVLLLEAGGDYNEPENRLLADRYATWVTHPQMGWGYKTTPQEALDNRQIDYSRGKGLGGSTLINFCCYTRGPKEDYDEWARKVDDPFFNWSESQRRIKKFENYAKNTASAVEKYVDFDGYSHGNNGSMDTMFASEAEKNYVGIVDAMIESGVQGLKGNLDLNSGDPLGVGFIPSTAKQSYRTTAASSFLKDTPPNLTIKTNSQVSKIVLEGKKVTGVVVNGETFSATKEVILSAGALDTPKILMLSGIGPAPHLKEHDIPVLLDIPDVGQNLQDHYGTSVVWEMKPGWDDRPALEDPSQMARAKEEFLRNGTGPLTTFNNSCIMAWIHDPATVATPEAKFLPAEVQKYISQPAVPTMEVIAAVPAFPPEGGKSYLSLTPVGMTAQSTGSVTLASRNAADAPLCDPQLLTNPYDKQNAIRGIRYALEIVKNSSLQKDMVKPYLVPADESDEAIWEFIKGNVSSTWHMSCTVRMGKGEDERACVDTKFRLKGIERLRVIDLSVLPFVPNAHTVSWAYLVGETGAERLISEYGLDG